MGRPHKKMIDELRIFMVRHGGPLQKAKWYLLLLTGDNKAAYLTPQMVTKENTTSAMACWPKAFAVKSDGFNPRNLVRTGSLLPPCRFRGWVECLPSMFKAQGLILSSLRTGYGGTRHLQPQHSRARAEGPEAQSYPQLHSELRANLGYRKF